MFLSINKHAWKNNKKTFKSVLFYLFKNSFYGKKSQQTIPVILQNPAYPRLSLYKSLVAGFLALTPLSALAAIAVSMSVPSGYSNPIFQGDITALQISITNSNPGAVVSGLAFSNALPAQLSVAGSGQVSYSCTDGTGGAVATTGSVTAVVGSGTISLTGGTIPQAGTQAGRCDMIVEVTSTVAGSHTNTIASGDVTGNDGAAVANTSPAAQSITVNALNAPAISKSFSPTTIVKDLPTQLTITISNANNVSRNLPLNNAGGSPAFAIQDVLPAGLEVAPTPNAASSCSGAGVAPAFTPSAGDTTLTALGGTVAAAGTCTLTVDVIANTTSGNYSNLLSNTINGTTQFGNTRGLTAANATASLTVTAPLRVSKSFSPSTVGAGQSANLTITLTNASPGVIALTSFTDDPIDGVGNAGFGLKIDGTPTTTCPGSGVAATGSNTGITLTGGSIPANSSCTITVPYIGTLQTPGTPQSFTNTIAQGAVGTSDAGIVSQPATHSVTVVDQLVVSKSVITGTVAPGNPVRFSVTVQNYSGGTLNNLRITDSLPGGMVALENSPAAPALSGTGCVGLTHDIPSLPATTGTPHFTIATVPPGVAPNPASCTVTFWAMLPANATVGSNLDNVIPANGVCDNNGAGSICNFNPSNATSARVTISSVATVGKVFSPSSTSEGTVSQLTVTYTNISAQPMTAVSFTDNLPLGSTGLQLVVADPAVASSTCAGAAITATPGSSVISMTGASIPARTNNGTGTSGTCTLRVNVIGPAGNYTNTLPAGAMTATETYADGSTNPSVSSPGPVSASLTYNSALTTSKSFAPNIIQSGGKSTVTVRFGNTGGGTLNNVSMTDPLPTGMVVATPANASTTCGGGAVINAVAGASSAGLTGAVIPASGQCDLIFDVTGTGGSNWVNTIPAGNVTATGGVQNVSPITATLTNNNSGALTITNSTGPNSLSAPGEVSVLTITFQNNGAIALTNLSLVDYFTDTGLSGGTLTGMRIADTPGVVTTCSGGVASAAPAGTSVSLNSASLAAGASCTVKVNVTLTTVGTVQNTIPANAATTSQGVSNALDTVTSLSALSTIGVTKLFTPAVVAPGTRSRLRITFINPLELPIVNLSTTDNLPAGVTVPAGANPTTTCPGATVSAPTSTQVQVAGGNLAAASGGVSATCQAEIDVFVASEGSYLNTIPSGGVTGTVDGTPVSNPVAATAPLLARTSATIGKAFSPSSVAPGVVSTLTISLINPNTIALTSAALTDSLPANVAVAPTPAASTTCAGGVVTAPASATSVSLASATVPANGSCTVSVNVVSNISGVYTNTIPAGGLTTTENITNENPATDVLTVSTPPVINKQFSPVAIPPNGTSTLTIVLDNSNASAITLTSNFDDVLPTAPGNIVVAATPAVSKTCPGTVTATAGAAFVRYNSGGTIPAGGCTISVNVTGATAGTHINVIPSGALVTNFGSNIDPASANLLISTLGYISGRVFQDNNVIPNGTYQSGVDTPIAGVQINLRDGSNSIVATTTTDDLGNYAFTGLAAGTYSVEEPSQPSSTVNGITSPGSIVGSGGGNAGTATTANTVPSRISSVVLGINAGQVDGSLNNNFAEVVLSSIAGTVFMDVNNNGLQNGADTALAGVAINLGGYSYGADGVDNSGAGDDVAVSLSTTTNASGQYAFTSLLPGKYTVTEPTQPSGSSNGITTAGSVPNGGTAGVASGLATVPSQISNIVLPPNTTSTDNNFAEITGSRSLYGQVFLDYDNSGLVNGNDHGIGGQTINLTGTDVNGNAVSRTTTTAADGSYSFTGLPEGTYNVAQPSQPSGTVNGITSVGSTGGTATAVGVVPSTISAIDLTAGNTVSANNNFAEVPGASPDLTIAKTHTPANFAAAGSSGYYTVTPGNIGTVATTGIITIVDTLPAGLTIAAPATGAGWACTGSVGASVVTCNSTTSIAANSLGNPITLRVAVAAGLSGQILINHAVIAGGGEPAGFEGNNSADDPTPIAAAAAVEGHVWLDYSHTREFANAQSAPQNGWIVELLLNGVQVASTTTDANGKYSFAGLAPGSGYQIRFRHPTTGLIYGSAVPNEGALAYTSGTMDSTANPAGAETTDGTLSNLTLASGTTTIGQSLPIDPAGVVYNAVSRAPVAGAVVTITGPVGFNPAAHLVGGTATVTTGADGLYQFLLNPTAPSGTYNLTVTTYPAGFLPAPSTLIPVCANTLTVNPTPDPALVQLANTAPATGATAHDPATCPATTGALNATNQASTQYYSSFVITVNANPVLSSANVVNNHIPLDPVLGGAIVVTKTTPLVNVTKGDLVPYTVTATNTLSAVLTGINVLDRVPPGFKYRTGSANLNGMPLEPTVTGRDLTWVNQNFAAGERKIYKLMLVVGTGVGEGEYINQAWALNGLVGTLVSNVANAAVRVTPDPTFDCSDIIGKVFDDRNANGYQDEGEPGIANVRVVTVRGLLVTTDADGRFHVTCADIPDSDHGANFVMKLDERTLPSGYRLTTENPRDVRVTRGKMVKLNFGATVHRVIRLDINNAAFADGQTDLLPEWQQALPKLRERLAERPSILRLAYDPGGGDKNLAQRRLDAVADIMRKLWKQGNNDNKQASHNYPLVVETVLEGQP